MENNMIESLRTGLPAIFARTEIDRLTGGAVKARTLSNLMSRGEGPEAYRDGKRVIIEREAFIKWYERRLQPIKSEGNTED
jgi:hypothetical protein